MATTLAILMALGIFIGGPALIGFAIAGVFYLSGRRAVREERVKALGEAVAEALSEQPAEEPAKEPVSVA